MYTFVAFINLLCSSGFVVGGVFILKEGWVLSTDRKKLMAQELLRQKSRELGRTPRKEDFDEVTRSRIKAFLGPWPRALEAAGLKEKRNNLK